MPVVTITLMKGYDEDTRRTMSERLTDAVLSTIAAPPEGTTVIINEVEAVGYMRGRQGRVPGVPLPDAEDVVRAYLDAMEARDLDGAKSHLADGFTMTFPGKAAFTTPEELVEWARPRYSRVAKVHEAMESFARDGATVVYDRGTLFGELNDGTPFEGVRYIDRFTVKNGRIVDQEVWNDFAEAMGGS